MRACVRACVRVCVSARPRAFVRVCAYFTESVSHDEEHVADRIRHGDNIHHELCRSEGLLWSSSHVRIQTKAVTCIRHCYTKYTTRGRNSMSARQCKHCTTGCTQNSLPVPREAYMKAVLNNCALSLNSDPGGEVIRVLTQYVFLKGNC